MEITVGEQRNGADRLQPQHTARIVDEQVSHADVTLYSGVAGMPGLSHDVRFSDPIHGGLGNEPGAE